ncbi:MAG: response regulator transcription factor [Micrococcales bacterium]|nr:response regulator transcription factor [Micrococcales bacterium]
MTQVLLAEDDPAIAEPLARALGREGYDVDVQGTGQGTIDGAPGADLVVLDLGLPDMDGLDVARSIRSAGLATPILVLTARAEEVDLVVGLDAGADDYVTKPFRLAELLARVRALLRRSGNEPADEDELRAQDVRVDVASRRAFQAERELHLTAKEFDLLRVLVAANGAVVGREQLMRDVWGSDPTGSTKTLDMHVSWLRRKLGDDANSPRYVTTVRGMGFRFETAATTAGAPAAEQA